MSGFVAVVNTDSAPVDRELLARMTEAMAFRGPDARHTWVDGAVGLGHALLATVDDYPEVPQPCSLDGEVWLAGDVRVDGRAELVGKLAARGDARALAAASDPELVLHAYRAWGERCVEHLIGDFAFAIWDGEARRLFCARDHMGVRPVYYAKTARALVVSNTLDAVRLHPDVSTELDGQTIGDFVLFGGAVDAARTGFAGVQRLRAAHTLTWAGADERIARYWRLPVEPPVRYRRPSAYAERLVEVLRAAVSDRMRTRHVGVSMSGGLDSSSVAALACAVAPGAQVRAYTTVYDDLIPDRERWFAGRVASHLGIPIDYKVADHDAPYARAPYAGAPECPMRTPAPAHHPFWAHEVAEYVRVAPWTRVLLTGQGGDAVFLPWPRGLMEQIGRLDVRAAVHDLWSTFRAVRGRLPRLGLRTAMTRALRPEPEARWPSWVCPDFAAWYDQLGRSKRLPAYAGDLTHPHKLTAYENLVDPAWDFVFEARDPGVTRQPVEARHPFFDVRVLRYALTLPSLPHCVEKHALREAMRGTLPEDVRVRPKSPLAGNPTLIKVRQRQADLDENFQPDPELGRFVRPGLLPTFAQIVREPGSLWTDTRPYSLNQWLRDQRPSDRGSASYSRRAVASLLAV